MIQQPGIAPPQEQGPLWFQQEAPDIHHGTGGVRPAAAEVLPAGDADGETGSHWRSHVSR
jgi:hypothetical protein